MKKKISCFLGFLFLGSERSLNNNIKCVEYKGISCNPSGYYPLDIEYRISLNNLAAGRFFD
jgi:hypothetical protein